MNSTRLNAYFPLGSLMYSERSTSSPTTTTVQRSDGRSSCVRTFQPGDLSRRVTAGEITFRDDSIASLDHLVLWHAVHFDTGGIVYNQW